MKVAAGEHVVIEHERVIGRRVQLGRDQPLGERERFSHRAQHLGRAAQ